MHNGFSISFAKGSVELVSMVDCEIVSDIWLATVLVYPLQYLYRIEHGFAVMFIFIFEPCIQLRIPNLGTAIQTFSL